MKRVTCNKMNTTIVRLRGLLKKKENLENKLNNLNEVRRNYITLFGVMIVDLNETIREIESELSATNEQIKMLFEQQQMINASSDSNSSSGSE